MIESRVVAEVGEGPDHAGLGVACAEDQSGDSGVDDEAGAHGAGLEGDDEGGVLESPVVLGFSGGDDGEMLGVGGGVVVVLAAVGALGEDLACGGVVEDGSDGDLAECRGVVCEFERAGHHVAIGVGGRARWSRRG